jgi:uncharacterized membrane protein YbhN (UPF0104 family)
MDGLFNVGWFFLLLGLLPSSASIDPRLRSGAIVMLALFGGGLLFLVAAYLAKERVLGPLERMLGRFSPSFARRIVALVATFLEGLVAIGGFSKILLFFVYTALYWGINGLTTYVLTTGYGVNVPLIAGPFSVACVVFAVTIPGAPGFAGTLEAGYRVGMAPFGVSPSDAALVAIVSHVLTLVLLALYVAFGFQIAEVGQRQKEKDKEGARRAQD